MCIFWVMYKICSLCLWAMVLMLCDVLCACMAVCIVCMYVYILHRYCRSAFILSTIHVATGDVDWDWNRLRPDTGAAEDVSWCGKDREGERHREIDTEEWPTGINVSNLIAICIYVVLLLHQKRIRLGMGYNCFDCNCTRQRFVLSSENCLLLVWSCTQGCSTNCRWLWGKERIHCKLLWRLSCKKRPSRPLNIFNDRWEKAFRWLPDKSILWHSSTHFISASNWYIQDNMNNAYRNPPALALFAATTHGR